MEAEGRDGALAAARELIAAARFEEAETSLAGLLADDVGETDRVEALYTIAVARRYRRDYRGALEAIDRLTAIRPDHARACQEAGHNHLSLNLPAEAARAFGAAVERNPALRASWEALANLHRRAGDDGREQFARAQVAYLAALPRELVAAKEMLHDGRLLKAERLCRRFLRDHPRHVEGMRLLAQIAIRLRIYDDAEFLLESAVDFAPDDTGARSDYLGILNRKAKFAKACEQARILCEAQPSNPAFRIGVANALAGLGRLDEAIAGYEEVLPGLPDPSAVLVMLGHAHKARGAIDDAVACYTRAAGMRPDYGDAWWSLANTKTYRFVDEELAAMRQHEAAQATGEDDRAHLSFALGKAYEDRGDYDAAFGHYRRGNDLRMRRSGYDPDKTDAMVEAQIRTCTRELFEGRGGTGCPRPDPIFIVGLPRAGSTLLEQILASHSRVDGTMELHDVLSLVQRLRGRSVEGGGRYPGILGELDADYFRRFGEQYLDNTQVYRQGAPFFIDKMPNNFMHVGLIRLILPNARVIDARRNPMACCFSGYKQLFGEGQDFSYSLEAIGRYYRGYVRLMDHWDEVLPGFVLRVMHEDVVADLEGQVRRLLDFCGLPFEEQCLEFHRTERSVRTPSSEQVRQPIYHTGLDQWRRFEAHLEPLRAALGPEVLARYPGTGRAA